MAREQRSKVIDNWFKHLIKRAREQGKSLTDIYREDIERERAEWRRKENGRGHGTTERRKPARAASFRAGMAF